MSFVWLVYIKKKRHFKGNVTTATEAIYKLHNSFQSQKYWKTKSSATQIIFLNPNQSEKFPFQVRIYKGQESCPCFCFKHLHYKIAVTELD